MPRPAPCRVNRSVIAQGFAGAAANGVFAVVRHRRAGVSRRHRAAPSAGLGQSAGTRRCEHDWRAGDRFHRVAGAEPRRAVGRRVPSAHRRQRHLGDRAGAQSGASDHRRRRRPMRIRSGIPTASTSCFQLAAIRQRWSGAAAAGGGPGGAAVREPRERLALSWTRDRRYILLRRDDAEDRRGPRCRRARAASRARWPSRSRRTTRRKDSSRRTAGGSRSSPTTAAVPKCSSSRFPTRSGRTQVSTAGGTQVRWSGDRQGNLLRRAGRQDDGGVDRVRRPRRRT